MMNIFFIDLDGTIEDSRADMAQAVHKLREQLDLPPLAEADVRPFLNQGMEALYTNCFGDQIDRLVASGASRSEAVAQTASLYEHVYGDHICEETKVYPGIPKALEFMASTGSLVLITNKPERLSVFLLRALGLADYFRFVMGGDSCAACKPDPLPLQLAADRLGYRPGQDRACMIGDSAGDILVASRFGIPSVWCEWGYAAEPGPLVPTYRIQNPSALIPLLSSLLTEAPTGPAGRD